MSFRRRALFLAGLFVAVSCSDAGNPIAPTGPEAEPAAGDAEGVLAVLTCTVDVRAGTETCEAAQPAGEDAVLAGLVQIGNGTQVTLTKTNVVSSPTSQSFDRAIKNHIYQPLGTVDGVTPDSKGVRVWIEPFVIDTAVAGQPTSVTVANPDGIVTYKTYKNRPYFQYPGLLQTGATSIAKNWQFSMQNVDAFSYKVFVLAEIQYNKGRIWIEPRDTVIAVDSTATLVAHVRDATKLLRENITWSSSNPAVVTVAQANARDTLPVITGVSEGTAWIRVKSDVAPTVRRDSVQVTVNALPQVPLDSIKALSNVLGSVSAARVRQGLSEGDAVVPSQTIDSGHGTTVIDANGALTYVADAGFSGQDTVRYNVTDGKWTVQRTLLVNVAPTRYWFVRQGGTGGGTNATPLGSINAASDSAAAGDTIFVLRNGSSDLVGAHTLDADEALIGAGVPAAFILEATDLNEANHKDLIFQGQGVGTPLMNTGAPTLTLGSNNLVRGVNISSDDAAAIHGVGFGTLTVGDVIVQAGGPALSLATGNLAGSFLALHSTNSDSSGISLTSVGGSLAATGSSITGAATTAFSVTGGSVAISFPGDVTHAGTGRLLQVSGHTGSASFAGALTATAGTGVLFSAAEGSYALNGAMSLNGGDAGLDVSSSGGVFTFANASVANPTGGPAVHVVGGTPAMFYRGSITHNTGRAVLVDGITADSVVLRAAITSGTADAPTGLGILVQNLTGGLVALDSAKSLFTGANPAVTVNNAAGAVRFGQSLAITTTAGAGFTASGAGTVTATGMNTVATGTGIPVSLTSVNTGAAGVSFSSISTSTGAANGIVLNGILGAGFQGTGGTISGTTGAAVLLTNTNAADSVSLRGMTLSRSAGAGAVIAGTNFGKLHVLNTSVTATGGPGALALATGTMSGTYSTVSSNASTGSGVSLTGVNGTFNASGGSINTAGAAAFLVSGGSVSGTISGTVGQASAVPLLSVTGGHETGAEVLTFAGNVTATNGNGLQFDNADGTYAFTASVTLQGGDAGIDITNGSGGDFTFPATANIVSPSTGNLVSILNSAPNFTYSGQFTKVNNNVTGILVSNNTGGTITFNGTGTRSISSGTAAAVSLANNGTASILFSGGGLSITSGSGSGFSATGGGTVQVTGGTNTIASTGGVALNVQNTTIGASGLSFQTINANGGANGIVLSSTGALNGLQVTGTGTNGSGGTIQNTTGGDGASAGNGVYLSSVRNVNLSWMALSGHANNGVYGNSVRGLTLDHVRITGNNGSSNSGTFEESPVQLVNSSGGIKITNSRLDGGAWNAFLLRNTSGAPTVDSLVMAFDTVSSMQGSTADVRNIALQAIINSGTADVRMRNNHLTYWWGNAVHVTVGSGASAVARITNNVAHQTSGALAGAGGIAVAGGNLQYNISGNSVRGTDGTAISADKQVFGVHMQGTIDSNTIGASGVANSGSGTGIAIFASHIGPNATTVRISNNVIRQVNGSANGAITTLTGDDVGGGGSGTMNATIVGNNIQESGTVVNNAQHGILVTHGRVSGDTDQGCYEVGGAGGLANVITNFNTAAGGSNVNRMRVNQRFLTTARFPGYTGANNDNAALGTYLLGRNTASNTANANSVAAGGGGFTNTSPAGSACPQPSI